MHEGRASRTAEHMALFRALEAGRPVERRLFADPFAPLFLGGSFRLVTRAARLPGVRACIVRFIDARWPGARTSAIARTRLIDDWLLAAIAAGLDQLVLLGAGFDARAYRLPEAEWLRVFEVDHPATLARKRAALGRAPGARLGHVVFVPVDFTRGSLAEAMKSAGYERGARTAFVWEGVTNYLSLQAVDAVLEWFAASRAGNPVIFTYVHRDVLEHPQRFPDMRRVSAILRRNDETWTFGLDPAHVPGYLAAHGLELLEDLGATDYRARVGCLPNLGYEFYRAVRARSGSSVLRGRP